MPGCGGCLPICFAPVHVIDVGVSQSLLSSRKIVAAAAKGQREVVDQKITTGLPGLARVSPMASITKFSTVSTTGTAEEIGQQTSLRERVEQGIKTAHPLDSHESH